MTNRISAAATALPAVTTRRAALASLAGVGAALSFPKVAKAATGSDHPDAVLIAHAAMVEQMAARAYAAITRTCDLDSELDRLKPLDSRPDSPEPLQTSEISVEKLPDGLMIVRSTPISINPAAARAVREQQEALDAWEAERDAISERLGVEAAGELHGDLYAALEDVVRDLTPMVPTSMAGVVAKARAAVALDPDGDNSFNDWEDELRSSVLRDVMMIGGEV